MIILAAMLLQTPVVTTGQLAEMQAGHRQWQRCITTTARRYASSKEIPETIVRAAFGVCEADEDRLLAIQQRYLGDESIGSRQLRRLWTDKLIAVVVSARSGRAR